MICGSLMQVKIEFEWLLRWLEFLWFIVERAGFGTAAAKMAGVSDGKYQTQPRPKHHRGQSSHHPKIGRLM
jgi:hypothetical protein